MFGKTVKSLILLVLLRECYGESEDVAKNIGCEAHGDRVTNELNVVCSSLDLVELLDQVKVLAETVFQ